LKSLTVFLALGAATATASAAKPCEKLKNEIAAQIDANHVTGYTLEIVANDDVSGRTVVGSCDGGTKKIVYENHAAVPATATAAKTGDEKK
jgi:hypothetical protein